MSEFWFKPRRFGYGARPVNWKGWASAFAVMVVLLGVVRFMVVPIPGSAAHPAWEVILGLAIALGLVAGFSRFAKSKTEGEWRWRWGARD
jgi:hypothetical protein